MIALVCVRAWVPVLHYAHFDSDQAVFGLMARDLLAGRGFPMFFYGQRYLLAVTVWLCAPLFAIAGASIATLKLPLFAMNVIVVVMLWVGLRRERGLSAWGTVVAILPFAIPSAVIATRLVEAAGGNIEPFIFLLGAFFVRDRPIALGVVLGVGFLNREFALIGLFALLLMDLGQGALMHRRRTYLIAVATGATIVIALRLLARWSNAYTGGLALHRRPGLDNLIGLFGQQLPTLVGGAPRALSDFNILSGLTVGHGVVYAAVIAWLVALAVAFVRRPPARDELSGMAAYLVLVGLGQAVAFLLLSPYTQDRMAVRYVLLTLLAMTGLAALAWRRPALRVLTAAVILLQTMVNLSGNLRLVREYATQPMVRPLNQLAAALELRGVRYAEADYWTAADVTWLTGERVIVSPPRGFGNRIERYSDALDAHRAEVFTISTGSTPGCEPLVSWSLCPPRPGAAR